MDITKVSLLEVTEQYLEYLHAADQIDAEALTEFIVIGAKLLLIKSASLLPQPPSSTLLQEKPDMGEELAQLLSEYKRFKTAAEYLREREKMGLRSYPRLAPASAPVVTTGLDGITIDQLFEALIAAMKRQGPLPQVTLETETIKITDKMTEIEGSLEREGRVGFNRLLRRCTSKREMIVSFLALLELIGKRRVQVRQDSLFAEILILPWSVA